MLSKATAAVVAVVPAGVSKELRGRKDGTKDTKDTKGAYL